VAVAATEQLAVAQAGVAHSGPKVLGEHGDAPVEFVQEPQQLGDGLQPEKGVGGGAARRATRTHLEEAVPLGRLRGVEAGAHAGERRVQLGGQRGPHVGQRQLDQPRGHVAQRSADAEQLVPREGRRHRAGP